MGCHGEILLCEAEAWLGLETVALRRSIVEKAFRHWCKAARVD